MVGANSPLIHMYVHINWRRYNTRLYYFYEGLCALLWHSSAMALFKIFFAICLRILKYFFYNVRKILKTLQCQLKLLFNYLNAFSHNFRPLFCCSQIKGHMQQMGLSMSSCGDDMIQFRRCLTASFFINAAMKQPDGSYRFKILHSFVL